MPKTLDKIFIINLKKDIEKKIHLQKLCDKFNLKPEFINAIDGNVLTKQHMDKVYSSQLSINKFGRELSKSEIGCFLSHKNTYKKIVNENIEMALILEDDVIFNNILLEILLKVKLLTNNWELILLGHHKKGFRHLDTTSSVWYKKNMISEYKLVRPCEIANGTYGYLITRNGAKKLLNYLDIITRPIDYLTGNSQYLNLYMVNPAPIKINEYLSDNYNSMQERTSLNYTLSNSKNKKLQTKIKNYLHIDSLLLYIHDIFKKVIPLRKYK